MNFIKAILSFLKSILLGADVPVHDNFKRENSHNIKIGGDANHSKIGNTENSNNTLTNNANNSGVVGHINDSVININNQLENENLKRKELHNFLFEDNVFSTKLSGIEIKNYQLWISNLVASDNFSNLLEDKLKDKSEIEFFDNILDAFIANHLSLKILEGSGDFSKIKQSLKSDLYLSGKSEAIVKSYMFLIASACDKLCNDEFLSAISFSNAHKVDIKEILRHAVRAFTN